MRIRRGKPEDADAVAEIQVRGWLAAYAGIMPGDHLATMTIKVRAPIWEKLLAEGVTFVGETRAGIVGFCSVGPARDDDLDRASVGEIHALYVEPGRWRRGIGQALCPAGLRWLKTKGFDAVSLWVLEANTIGRGFYEKLGFAPDGRTEPYQAAGTELKELRYLIDL